MRKVLPNIIAGLAVLAIFGMIAGVFWYQDMRYSLPTPRPAGLTQVPLGSEIQLPEAIARRPGVPLAIHFYRADCPCSRFNVDHLRSLIKQYREQVDFVVAVQADDGKLERGLEKFKDYGLNLAVYADQGAALAKALGVYSTPQAAVIDAKGKLYYRGNYNKTRYCTDKDTQYVRVALASVTKGLRTPAFDRLATLSYGCELPRNRRPQN